MQIQEVPVVNEYHGLVSKKSKDNKRYKNTVYESVNTQQ